MSIQQPTAAFPLIEISGPPEQRGRQYGERAQVHILRSLENYKIAFADWNISWEAACGIASSFIPQLDAIAADLLSEVRATAAASGVRTEELLTLNCRTEILYGSGARVDEPTDGCTGAIALPSATASGDVLHGQNWDWRDECADTSIILRIKPEKGPVILTHTEAGNLARCGMNEEGIALTGNFLKCDRDNQPGGIPIPFVRRTILQQTNLNDAFSVVLKTPKSFSTNLMISDASGECINFETVPGETFWLSPEDGLLVHANHFESIPARVKLTDLGLEVAPCSLYRSRRVRERLSRDIGNLTLDDFTDAFSDRFGAPSAVCASPDLGPGGDTSSTVATILMNVSKRRMMVAPRPYIAREYTEYGFGG